MGKTDVYGKNAVELSSRYPVRYESAMEKCKIIQALLRNYLCRLAGRRGHANIRFGYINRQ